MRLVWCLLLLCVALAQSKRSLLEEQIASAVDAFHRDDASAEQAAQSLGRMLLAFKALENLKPAGDLLGDGAWRDSLLDSDRLDPLNIADLGSGPLRDAAAAGVEGTTDAVASLVDFKKDFASKLIGVSTGKLSLEEAASEQVLLPTLGVTCLDSVLCVVLDFDA